MTPNGAGATGGKQFARGLWAGSFGAVPVDVSQVGVALPLPVQPPVAPPMLGEYPEYARFRFWNVAPEA
jgi:hypothetical protein